MNAEDPSIDSFRIGEADESGNEKIFLSGFSSGYRSSTGYANTASIFNFQGDKYPNWPVTTDYWVMTEPVSADFYGNGQKEIVVGSCDEKVYSFTNDGKQLWKTWVKSWVSKVETADVTGDGIPDIIVKTKTSYANSGYDDLLILNSKTGAILDGFPIGESKDGNGYYYFWTANISGDKTKEILALKMRQDYTFSISAIRSDGSEIWESPQEYGYFNEKNTQIGDLDGTGYDELISYSKDIRILDKDGVVRTLQIPVDHTAADYIGDFHLVNINGSLDMFFTFAGQAIMMDSKGNIISKLPTVVNYSNANGSGTIGYGDVMFKGYDSNNMMVLLALKDNYSGTAELVELYNEETFPLDKHPRYDLSASPNPFNDKVVFTFTLPEDRQVSVDIFNSIGQLIRSIPAKDFKIGHNSTEWDGRDNSGIRVIKEMYFARFKMGSDYVTEKIVFSKE